jgi:hypothetical protein
MTVLDEARAIRAAVDSLKNPFERTAPNQEELIISSALRLADQLEAAPADREALTDIILRAGVDNRRARSAWIMSGGQDKHPGAEDVAQADAVLAAGYRLQAPTPEALAEALCDAMPHPGGGSQLVYEDALEAARKALVVTA